MMREIRSICSRIVRRRQRPRSRAVRARDAAGGWDVAERERWDAIVIGSGLGGLTCGAYLCATEGLSDAATDP